METVLAINDATMRTSTTPRGAERFEGRPELRTIVFVWQPPYFVAGRTDDRCYRDPMRGVIPIDRLAKAEVPTLNDVSAEELVAFERPGAAAGPFRNRGRFDHLSR
jgi:hypothetical protein